MGLGYDVIEHLIVLPRIGVWVAATAQEVHFGGMASEQAVRTPNIPQKTVLAEELPSRTWHG